MTPRAALVCLLTIAAIAALPAKARAEHTRYWKQSDFSDFQKGTAKGVAIRSDGRLTPAPKFAPLADPNLAYLWALRLDSRGDCMRRADPTRRCCGLTMPEKPRRCLNPRS